MIGRKSDVNVVRVSSERRLADVKTNDSDVPSLLDGCEDEMQIHLSSERRLDDVALLSEIRDPRSVHLAQHCKRNFSMNHCS